MQIALSKNDGDYFARAVCQLFDICLRVSSQKCNYCDHLGHNDDSCWLNPDSGIVAKMFKDDLNQASLFSVICSNAANEKKAAKNAFLNTEVARDAFQLEFIRDNAIPDLSMFNNNKLDEEGKEANNMMQSTREVSQN